MAAQDNTPKITSLDELLAYREQTERISAFLHRRLKTHLATLYPLLAPKRVFGKYVGARESAPHADEAYAQLAQRFKEAGGSPFELRQDLDPEALASTDGAIEVYPWEYSYEARGPKATKTVSMTSPLRWVVTYGSEYSLSQMRALVQTSAERRTQSVRNFVVNALAFHIVLARAAGIEQLIKDLRYEINAQPLPALGKLPLVVFSVPLPSFRPADELLLTATRLSGVQAFIELIDTSAAGTLEDPLRRQIEVLLAQG